jgi:hypothetical protein
MSASKLFFVRANYSRDRNSQWDMGVYGLSHAELPVAMRVHIRFVVGGQTE